MPEAPRLRRSAALAAAALVASASLPLPASAAACRPVTVTDGDTVEVPTGGGQTGLRMRIEGIDTPEIHGKCPEERALAQEARSRMIQLALPCATPVSNLEFDRYGRVLGKLYTQDGRSIGDILLAERLARVQIGSAARKPWCPAAPTPN